MKIMKLSPIHRMVKNGVLDDNQASAFEELRLVAVSLSRGPFVRTSRVLNVMDRNRSSTFDRGRSLAYAAQLHDMLARWQVEMGVGAVIALAFAADDTTLQDLALKHRMRFVNARAQFISALSRWAEMRQAERNEVAAVGF